MLSLSLIFSEYKSILLYFSYTRGFEVWQRASNSYNSLKLKTSDGSPVRHAAINVEHHRSREDTPPQEFRYVEAVT